MTAIVKCSKSATLLRCHEHSMQYWRRQVPAMTWCKASRLKAAQAQRHRFRTSASLLTHSCDGMQESHSTSTTVMDLKEAKASGAVAHVWREV